MLAKRNRKKDLETMERFKAAFEAANGFMPLACRASGISRFEVEQLRDIYPAFDTDINEFSDYRTALVANKMYELAYIGKKVRTLAGDEYFVADRKAMEFWLKTQGAHMGFIERKSVELEVRDRRPKVTAEQISDDPIEASRQYQDLIS
jgi:hypothetical protein